jgi:hypothetical protein
MAQGLWLRRLHVQPEEVHPVMRRALAAALLAVSAWWGVGCTPAPHESWDPGYAEQQGPPNWTAERQGFKHDVDEAIDQHDCAKLDQLFGEALGSPANNPAVLTHIERWERHLGCPGVDDEPTG